MNRIYPSKRVKNHAAKKLRRIFDLKGRVILKHTPQIIYDGDNCMGLHYWGFDKNGMPKHTIIISEEHNNNMQTYLETILHEYVHAWQFENEYPLAHSRRSRFHAWAKYLKQTQNVNI
jgi:hypothetical protein